MASFIELSTEVQRELFLSQIKGAVMVAAIAVTNEPNGPPGPPAPAGHATRLAWAKTVFANPDIEKVRFGAYVLGLNSGLTVLQIRALTDTQIQTGVNSAVTFFIG